MFFAPTVQALTNEELGNHVKILCLSSGMAPNPSGQLVPNRIAFLPEPAAQQPVPVHFGQLTHLSPDR